MAAIVIKVDGADITDEIVFSKTSFTSVADGNVGTCEIVIDDQAQTHTPADFVTGMTIELLIDGVRHWDGWLFTTARSWPLPADDTSVPSSVPRFWVLKGQDRNLLFHKRVLFRQSDPEDNRGLRDWDQGTPDKEALDFVIANYVDLSGDGIDTSSGIKQIASPGPYEDFTLGFVSGPLGVAFEDAAQMTGGVYFIGPDRVLRYVSDVIETAPFKLSDTPTGAEVGYREAIAERDFTQAATEALVWGAGKGSSDPVFARYRNYISDYGLWQWGDVFVGAFEQQTVNRRAETYVEGSPSHRRGHGQPVPVVRCVIHEPGLYAGLVVDFSADTFGYQENLPIRTCRTSFPTPTDARFELELTLKIDTPFGIPDLWPFPPWSFGEIIIEPPPPGPIGGAVSADLIDHYDVALPVTLEDTFTFQSELFFATVLQMATRTRLTWSLPVWVEADDLVLLHGLAVNDLSVGGGFFVSNVDSSFQWSFDSAASSFWGTGYMKPGASTDEVWVEFDHNVPGTPDVVAAEAMITVVKGKAFAETILVPGDASPFDPTQTYADLDDDATAVVGSAFTIAGDAHIFPLDTTPIKILGLASQTTYDWGSVTWKYLGDSYTADDIDWPSGDPGIFKPTEKWWQISDLFRWLTPGPERTGHTKWPGGNEYVTAFGDPTLTVLDAPNSEVKLKADLVAPIEGSFGIYDSFRYYLDDATGARTGLNDPVVQGQFIDDGTPAGPWHEPMDWLVRFRTDDILTSSGYVDFRHDMMSLDPGADPSELDAGGTELYVVSWLAEIGLTILWRDDGTQLTMELDAYTNWNGGSGILPEVETDTSSDFDDGTFEFIKFGEWDHNWVVQLHKLIDVQPQTEYYFRLNTKPVYNAQAGARRWLFKIWKASDEEPVGWMIEDVMPMYKAAAFKHDGLDSIGGEVSPGDFSSSYRSFWRIDGRATDPSVGTDSVGVNAIWALSGVGSGRFIVSDIPIYDNADTIAAEASLHVTRYPYQAGSLRVSLEGVQLRPGVDFIETNPVAGEFRILGTGFEGGLNVDYIRAGTVESSSGGGVYRPRGVLQYGWGTPLDGVNAVMAAAAVALDRHTEGAYTVFVGSPRSTPPNIRGNQSDLATIGDVTDAATAWSNGWGQTMVFVGNTSWSDFASKVDAGRGGILMGNYGDMPSAKRFSDAFSGTHAIYVNEIFSDGSLLGFDPLNQYPIIYTPAQLQAFAVGFASPGLVRAGFTQDTD